MEQLSAISISPPDVVAAGSCTLKITSSGGFDLSKMTPAQVAISPAEDISNLAVSDPSARGLTVSFNLASDAQAGERVLSIVVNNVRESAKFKVARISISPNRIIAVPGTPQGLSVSSDGFDLSNVGLAQVRIRPATDIANFTVTNATERHLSLALSFRLANEDFPGIARELTITVNNVSASAKFDVLPT